MQFIHTHELIINRVKTQTRRLVKPGDEISAAQTCIYRYHPYRILYEVGRTYAVQPARTAKAIARIRITGIRMEDVRNISGADVEAEGFSDMYAFLETWCKMHDPAALGSHINYVMWVEHHGYDVLQWLATRPVEKYQCWALTFCLVQPC